MKRSRLSIPQLQVLRALASAERTALSTGRINDHVIRQRDVWSARRMPRVGPTLRALQFAGLVETVRCSYYEAGSLASDDYARTTMVVAWRITPRGRELLAAAAVVPGEACSEDVEQ